MLHHVDIHVRDLAAAKRLFDALAETIRYRVRVGEADFVGYEPLDVGRPRVGFLLDPDAAGGSMRLAFGVDGRRDVAEAARIAATHGARSIEGPSLHPEYGDDYYAVFFEDAGGNRFEVVADPAAVRRPRLARIWRSRIKPGQVRAYRRYISATGLADYRSTDGNCGAWMLTAARDDFDDVITLSFWESRDAIARFAGAEIDRAQYYPEDEKYLLDFPERVEHFDID
jgi:heme-degrading monooxygenase HmoA/predicted lactoylglutathione lyase